MRHAGGQRAPAQPETAHEGQRRRCCPVAVEHQQIEHVAFRIGHDATVFHPRRQQRLARQQFAVAHVDHPQAFAGGGHVEVGRRDLSGLEVVDQTDRRPLDQAASRLGDQTAIYPGTQRPEIAQVRHFRRVHRIAHAQQADRQAVVQHRVDAGAAQHVERVMPRRHRPRRQAVDMAARQIVGMLVVAAEHHPVRMAADKRLQRIEIARRRAFPDQDVHAAGDLVARLCQADAFVVAADAGLGIAPRPLAGQAGRMPVHRQAEALRQRDPGHDGGIARQHAGEVHHFGKVKQAILAQEDGDFIQIQAGACGLERRRRHARGRAEEHLERHLAAVLQHVAHARQPQHVGNLVRIGDCGHGAVADGQTGKFGRRQHRAFNMHMRIDEAGDQVTQAGHLRPGRVNNGDHPVAPYHLAGGDTALQDIDDVGVEGSGIRLHLGLR